MSIRMNTEDVIARGQEIGSHVEDVTTLQNYLNDVVNNQLPELWLSLIHISEPMRQNSPSRMPSSA